MLNNLKKYSSSFPFRLIVIILLISNVNKNILLAQSKIYYVNKNGNDNNVGTKKLPLKSLIKVVSLLKPGDTCIVGEGTYVESITPLNNGTASDPIVLMAAKGEHVVLSGMEIVGGWQKGNKGSYSTKINWDLDNSNMLMFDTILGNEARFPNKASLSPFVNTTATTDELGVSEREEVTRSNPKKFFSKQIPSSFASSDLTGASVWMLAQYKWSAWIASIIRFDNSEKALYIKSFDSTQNWVSSNHNPNFINKEYGKNTFYLYGAKAFLDTAYEWYLNHADKELSIILPKGKLIKTTKISFCKYATLIDMSNTKYWKIVGFDVIGGNIKMHNSENCTIERCNFKYFWHSYPRQSQYASNGISGIDLGGQNNVIRNCEIAYSIGAAITLSGNNNIVVNNLIHDHNFLGSMNYGIIFISNGFGNRICNNTIYSAGRDCFELNGHGGEIAYNNIYNSGLLCRDLGVFYAGATDVSNLEIHHNYIHNSTDNKSLGIYLDNFSQNCIVHNNVIWGIKESIRLNRPSNYHFIYNNIVEGINNSYGPWNGPSTQFGSMIFNNVSLTPIVSNPEVSAKYNIIGEFPFDTISKLSQKKYFRKSNKSDVNMPIYSGAFYSEVADWKAGHDFSIKDFVLKERAMPFFRNYINNGSFELPTIKQKSYHHTIFDQWEDSGTVRLIYESGFNYPGPETRNSIYSHSLLLQSDGANILQKIDGLLKSQSYKAGVYVKNNVQSEVVLSIKSGNQVFKVSSKNITSVGGWKLLELQFIPVETENNTLSISKYGQGDVYLDNIGVIPNIIESK